MLGALIQIDAFDTLGLATVTMRMASVDDETVCGLNGQSWFPVIDTLPQLSYDFFSGAFDGRIQALPANLSFAVEPWPLFSQYTFADARVQLWTGTVGAAWGAYTKRFDGRATGDPSVTDAVAALGMAVDDAWLDGNLLTTYLGTGGVEGPPTLKGQEKPLGLGAPRYVPGTLIDAVNQVWQVSGYGLIEGYDAALDRLVRYPAPLADYATHAALIAATIAAGQWATCNSEGKSRFGAPPYGKVSFLLKGDKAGPDGWCRTPGKIARRLALLSGGAGKIDDASLNALDISRPYNVSIFMGRQTTGRQRLQAHAASVNAVMGVSHLGKLFIAPVGIGASVLRLDANGPIDTADVPVLSVEKLQMGAPFWKLGMAAERTWNLHGDGDYAAVDALPGSLDFAQVNGATKPESNADVTLLVTGGKTVAVAYDYTPAPKAGQLPLDANFKLVSGAGTDVTTAASWSATLKSGGAVFTPTVGSPNSTGTLNVTACTSDAVIEMKATYAGKTRVDNLTVQRMVDPAPATGGAGGGTSDSTSSITAVSSTSYGAANTRILSCKAGSGGQVACSFSSDFLRSTGGGPTGCLGKWQWRVVGGSFADIATEIASDYKATKSGGTEPFNDPGYINSGMTKTGLTAGTTYEFQLLLRADGAGTLNYTGTASTVGS